MSSHSAVLVETPERHISALPYVTTNVIIINVRSMPLEIEGEGVAAVCIKPNITGPSQMLSAMRSTCDTRRKSMQKYIAECGLQLEGEGQVRPCSGFALAPVTSVK